jgi:hypothetical protein
MSRSDLINPPRKVPELTLHTAHGERCGLKPRGHGSAVLLFLHADCARCETFVSALASERKEIASWNGDVRIVSCAAAHSDTPFEVLLDEGSRAARALAIEAPAILIVDRWGEIHESAEGGEDHAFLPVVSVVEWVRHLATQCPECEGEAY